MPLFNLIFLGLGWLWVGEFDGFIMIFTLFPKPRELGKSQTTYYNFGPSWVLVTFI